MAVVAANPVPIDLVALARGVEALPEIDILDGFFLRGLPAVRLPSGDPFGDAVSQILRIRVQVDRAAPFQRFQRRNCRHQFHAIVGRERLPAINLPLAPLVNQNSAPASRARIALAAAVGVDRDDAFRLARVVRGHRRQAFPRPDGR